MPGRKTESSLPDTLSSVKALVLDIDGILYEGQQALPGAAELIDWLNTHNFPYVLFSNNSTRPFPEHVAKLASLGMPVKPDHILTAARVTAMILAREQPGALCLAIGEAGLSEALQFAGLQLVHPDADERVDLGLVKFVVIGLDRTLTYDKLKIATRALRKGAKLISSNPDPLYPDGVELIPASGVIQAALETAASVSARVIGKPEMPGFHLALQILGQPARSVAMLGDQLETDILGAKRAGLRTFLVLSSITPVFEPQTASVQPDRVFCSTLDFFQQWISLKH